VVVTAIPSRARHRTGSEELDARLAELLDEVGADQDRDQLFEILVSAVRLATDDADRLDLKITNAVLKEMREAFAAFAPYESRKKVTIFGSARTRVDHPAYAQARDLAARLSAEGWMVVTGAGPGIMSAGLEGAGRPNSFGVNIRLPFEQAPNPYIHGDPKLISMKYFFTRKLMLVKESHGFVSLPGGFGTLDETFELLTLTQTGKSIPAPLVLLDEPGGDFWHGLDRYLRDHVATNGYIHEEDLVLYRITDSVDVAAEELLAFGRNFHSIRWVRDRLVIRLHVAPTAEQLATINREFAELCTSGAIEATEPLREERSSGDALDLPRLVLTMDTARNALLRALIDHLNRLVPAGPSGPSAP
jgi:uncharacterized protein (TIGR00730 family)